MENNTIIYNKEYRKSNSYFKFVFKGNKKLKNINIHELSNLLDNAFSNLETLNDISKNIFLIRTILGNMEEENLKIQYVNSEVNLIVSYKNSELKCYEETKRINKNKEEFKFLYDNNKGMSVIFDYSRLNINKYELSGFISSNIKKIDELKNIKATNLNNESKILCQIYKLFYNEDIDFNLENIDTKIQCMYAILSKFNIIIESKYNFSLKKDKIIPWSLQLQILINELKAYGKIEFINNPVKIPNNYEELIKIIGKNIKTYTLFGNREIEKLKQIALKIYSTELETDIEMKEILPLTKEQESAKELIFSLLSKKY